MEEPQPGSIPWPLPNSRPVGAAFASSGAGHLFHNLVEFPLETLVAWETLLPIAITVLLWAGWYLRPGRDTFAVITGWAAIVLIFGGGSVIPFGFLPFTPEQSLSHYTAHLVYGVSQLPLLWVGLKGFRSTATTTVNRPAN